MESSRKLVRFLRHLRRAPVGFGCRVEMLPDFILTDAEDPIHIEVYGMNGVVEYEARKRQKQRFRVAHGTQAVEWDIDAIELADVRFPPVARCTAGT